MRSEEGVEVMGVFRAKLKWLFKIRNPFWGPYCMYGNYNLRLKAIGLEDWSNQMRRLCWGDPPRPVIVV